MEKDRANVSRRDFIKGTTAAGAAAAIAVQTSRTPREVSAKEIQKHLLDHGAAEPEIKNQSR